jgi:4-alpha-glucanotransferase
MRFPRASGVLLHPTSFPGPTGIGELGPEAYRFLDFLAAAGQSLWQVLPLGPTGYGGAPYSCYSAFAGNPLMISLEQLVSDGLLEPADLEPGRALPKDRVDFGAVETFKDQVLEKAFQTFRVKASPQERAAFRSWCEAPDTAAWLEDYALFMALKRTRGGKPWHEWEPGLAFRDPATLRKVIAGLEEGIWYQRFLQWQFERQWAALRRYAHGHGIEIVGDIPIYVTDDSADVWSNPELFYLDERGRMTAVAGVPPDYFSKTGQLWGNPLYRWDRMERTGYSWWIARLKWLLGHVDRIRLDHFRGFEAYWEVPAGEETAVNGRWAPGPGAKLFQAVRRALGTLPILAEDLGVITPEVEELRDTFEFPGMKILQFAFGSGATNAYLPHNYHSNAVVYTGTHDNDTTLSWFSQLEPSLQDEVNAYCGSSGGSVVQDLVRVALGSVADTCIVPLQDLLELGGEARMNTPGVPAGNWGWRYQEGVLTGALSARVRRMAELYGRAVPLPKEAEGPEAIEAQ